MKILTNMPAVIASITDLVERNVTSDLEIEQTSLYPLPSIPQPVTEAPGSLNVVSSVNVRAFMESSASAPANINNVMILQAGLWRLGFTVFYRADFARIGTDGLNIQLSNTDTVGFNIPLFSLMAMAQTGGLLHEFFQWVTLRENTRRIQIVMGPTGVAQTHAAVISIRAERYL